MSMQNMGMTSPLKRMSPMGGHMSPRAPGMPPMKRARMPGPYNTMSMSHNLNSAGAVNPETLDTVGRLCRVCGAPNAVIFRLKEKQELIGRINKVLNLTIDLEVDANDGYPGVICRKCCNLVETFFHYKKSVSEGQISLKKQVEEDRERKATKAAEVARLQAEAAEREQQLLNARNSPECIGVDPLDSILPDQGSSILPDANQPDTKVGNIRIKQESLKTLSQSEPSSSVTTAPMTAVFTDAVPDIKIKVEPGVLTIKKEKLDETDIVQTEKNSNTHGELFSQLVGEVNKLNDATDEQNNEATTTVSETPLSESSKVVDIESISVTPSSSEISTTKESDLNLQISNVDTCVEEDSSAKKSVTEVLGDISDTLEVVTKHIVSQQGEINAKKITVSDSNKTESIESQKERESQSAAQPTQDEKPSEEVNEADRTKGSENVAKSDTKSNDALFSDIKLGEDPWSESNTKSKDDNKESNSIPASWVPDAKGVEDLESAPAMTVRDLRQRSDFFYDEDYYNDGGDGDGSDLVPGSDDPLMEMDDDDNTGDTDDFGGYDPLKLVQMTGGNLNELDFEMEDFDEDITMEDHDIMGDKEDHLDEDDDHDKDAELSEEIRDIDTKKVSQIDDQENDLDISDESGLSDSRDGMSKDFHQNVDEYHENTFNLDNDDDPPEKEAESMNPKSQSSEKFSKNKTDDTVENTLDDSKEDDNVPLDVKISSSKSVNEISSFRDHISSEVNLNEDCDDDLKDDTKSNCDYSQHQEDHNFESVELSKDYNFDSTSDDKDNIDHHDDGRSSQNLREGISNQEVLSEDVSTDLYGASTENVDDINDFNNSNEADFGFQIAQVQSIQESSQAEDSAGTEPGSNCDNSA